MKLDQDALKAQSPEEVVLLSIGHEIVNFSPRFPKKSLKHTFILSQYGSAMFGLMPRNNQVYLGIPQTFYEKFKSAKWLYAAKLPKEPGLFLVMMLGTGNKAHEAAIRVFIRSKRMAALDETVKTIRVVPMDGKGITREKDVLNGFNLRLMQLEKYTWEFVENESDFDL
ncbi:hypothetical protein ACYPKM_02910 [Pseudomonas aeruginosa]